jgi:hypothetical protein
MNTIYHGAFAAGIPAGLFFMTTSEVLMCVRCLIVGSLCLLLGACSRSGGVPPPPPINKQLLVGPWKNQAEMDFLTGYEFADNGSVKMTVKEMEQPVTGRYAWSGERTLEVEFPAAPDVRKAFKAAVKAYKDHLADFVKTQKLDGRIIPSLSMKVPDALPDKETFRVALSEQSPLLILHKDNGVTQTFERKK